MSDQTEAALPLFELDRQLAPVRRLLAYAVRPEAQVRLVHANMARWLAPAESLELPEAVSGMLKEAREVVAEVDRVETDAHVEAVASAAQLIARVDALLGLPLPARRLRPPRRRRPPTRSNRRGRPTVTEDGAESKPRSQAEPAAVGDERPSRAEPAEPTPARPPAKRRVEPLWRGSAGESLSDLDVSDALVAALAEEGLTSVEDILLLRPASYEQLTPIHGAGRELPGEGRIAVGGRLRHWWTVCQPDGSMRVEAKLVGAGPLKIRWSTVGPDWWLELLGRDSRMVLAGDVVLEDGHPVLVDPEIAEDDGRQAVQLAQYAVDGVEDREIRQLVLGFLPGLKRVYEPLPDFARAGLPAYGDALRAVHRQGGGRSARRRLAMNEAVQAQIGLSYSRFAGPRVKGIAHTVLHGKGAQLLGLMDLELSEDQLVALEDIKRDLRRSRAMRRVLTGDSATGKGSVVLLACALVAENKCQVVVTAPSAMEAEALYTFAQPVLREVGLVARVVDDKPSESVRDAVRRGEIHVLYGTRALLDAKLEYRRLGLIVAQERGDLGGSIKQVEQFKQPKPDVLIQTIGPVTPDALLAGYPDFDVSVVKRRTDAAWPESRVFKASEREQAYEVVRENLERRNQALIVFPMIRGSDALDLQQARTLVSALESEVLSGARIALYHGALSREERRRVHQDFRHRRYDVLVATSMVELGPGVPGVRVVVAEQADLFGLSRLHHLTSSLAMEGSLVVAVVNDDAQAENLAHVERTLASRDNSYFGRWLVEQRGLALLVDPQRGAPPDFHWVDSDRDASLLLEARLLAHEILQQDTNLRAGQHAEMVRQLRSRWDRLWPDDGFSCVLPDTETPPERRRRRRRRRRR